MAPESGDAEQPAAMVPWSRATASPKSVTKRPSLVLSSARRRQSEPSPVKTNTAPALFWPPQSSSGAEMAAVEPCSETARPKPEPSSSPSSVSRSRLVQVLPLRV